MMKLRAALEGREGRGGISVEVGKRVWNSNDSPVYGCVWMGGWEIHGVEGGFGEGGCFRGGGGLGECVMMMLLVIVGVVCDERNTEGADASMQLLLCS